MTLDPNTPAPDLIRWTFTSDPSRTVPIEEYLTDLGLDVLVYDDCKFLATWDEPDRDLEEVITAIWDINGAPFEVTQEEFQRLSLNLLHHVEDDAQDAA